MKILKVFLLFSILFCIVAGYRAYPLVKAYLDNEKFMSLNDAQKKWGHEAFDVTKFKKGDTKVRASMAVSLIESKKMIGKDAKEIWSELGEFTGYFWNDNIPTYLIEEGNYKEKKDAWQIVFLLGYKKRIREVKIHRNCCSSYN